jgi:hydroxymethylpyrimidine/phosphomethylpyrimidine kinase
MSIKPARILIIAGSDSSGGAGIQADIKTVTCLGGYAMSAVTAVTVQNTFGVSGIHPIPPDIVAAQIRACIDDIGIDAVKIGMLGSFETVFAVADALSGVKVPIVLDPVMVAKGGAKLIDDDAGEALITRLLPLATVITPNAPELAELTSTEIEDAADALLAAQELLHRGPRAVLAKGGHLPGGMLTDWLVTRGGHVVHGAVVLKDGEHEIRDQDDQNGDGPEVSPAEAGEFQVAPGDSQADDGLKNREGDQPFEGEPAEGAEQENTQSSGTSAEG